MFMTRSVALALSTGPPALGGLEARKFYLRLYDTVYCDTYGRVILDLRIPKYSSCLDNGTPLIPTCLPVTFQLTTHYVSYRAFGF